MRTSKLRLSPSRGKKKQLRQDSRLKSHAQKKSPCEDSAELTAVTAQGHHMFAQLGFCRNVMLKDEAQRIKFA